MSTCCIMSSSSTEYANKDTTGLNNAQLAAERLISKKTFTSTTSHTTTDKAGGEHKSDKSESGMSHSGGGTGGNTRALAGLMMVKRRMGNWKRNAKAGSAMGGSSHKSGLRMVMENSYQMSPTQEEKFDVTKVKQVVDDSLRLFLIKQSAYNPTKCAQISRYISEDVKSRMKTLGFKRYKFVVNVIVGQTKEQGMEFASRCVWNTETDNMATVTRQHKDMYVVVNVYGVYVE